MDQVLVGDRRASARPASARDDSLGGHCEERSNEAISNHSREIATPKDRAPDDNKTLFSCCPHPLFGCLVVHSLSSCPLVAFVVKSSFKIKNSRLGSGSPILIVYQ